jgi:uncharacterized phosphatase
MKIHLLRHGQTDWNLEGRVQGQKNVPLNQTGKQQITRFSTRVEYPYSLIVTSPLRRAVQSAELCSVWLGLPLVKEPLFAERAFGMFEGLRKDEVYKQFQIADIEMLDKFPGVESMSSFRERLEAGLRRLTKQYSEERILLVTHGSVIRLLTMMTRTTSTKSTQITRIDDFPQIVANGSVVEIDIS